MRERRFQSIRVGERAFTLEVMIYGEILADRQPLLVFHSIEFAMPPPDAFCEALWQAGFQVIFVRRPGFGTSSPLPPQLMTKKYIADGVATMTEAAMLHALIRTLDLKNIVLLAIGSSNPVCFRLVHMGDAVKRVIFVNPIFHQDVMSVFRPAWFRSMLEQVISSKSGLRVAETGMKLLIKRDPITFYEAILKNSRTDLEYVRAHREDYCQAGELALETTGNALYYEAMMCLTKDPLLKDDYFDAADAGILIGEDSVAIWQTEMHNEAHRLNLPLHYAPKGDIFCAHASPEKVIELALSEDLQNGSATLVPKGASINYGS